MENVEVKTRVDYTLQYFLSDEWDDNTFVRKIERSNALNVAGRIRVSNPYRAVQILCVQLGK